MGGVQWGVLDVAGVPGLKAPGSPRRRPTASSPFSTPSRRALARPAGVVTALGHDAALMAGALAIRPRADRAGLTRPSGFDGVLGGFRFLADGRCQRDLAMLTIERRRSSPSAKWPGHERPR